LIGWAALKSQRALLAQISQAHPELLLALAACQSRTPGDLSRTQRKLGAMDWFARASVRGAG
jgi:hypothetical protein